jgi:ketosteroid isomerase-like protein
VSDANVALVRSSFEAFGRGDFDTAFASHHPRVQWRTAADEPDAQTYRGLDEVRRFASGLAAPWQDRFSDTVAFEDFIDCGDWVVAPWTARLHGHGSGIEIEVSETYAVRVTDGRIAQVVEYRATEQALEAVGPAQ